MTGDRITITEGWIARHTPKGAGSGGRDTSIGPFTYGVSERRGKWPLTVPFRGEVSIGYSHATTFEASGAQVTAMLEQLQGAGWSADTDFVSHGRVVRMNNVDAEFVPYHPNDNIGGITLYGQCRDTTTNENTMPEPVSLSGAQSGSTGDFFTRGRTARPRARCQKGGWSVSGGCGGGGGGVQWGGSSSGSGGSLIQVQ